jgi:ribosomal protein L21
MHAIIETGGKQYRVQEKEVLMVEKLEAEEGTTITLDRVLAILNDGSVRTGSPVEGATVTAKVLAHGKGKKISVFKYKSKSNYRRRQGHRQPFTRLMIESIQG